MGGGKGATPPRRRQFSSFARGACSAGGPNGAAGKACFYPQKQDAEPVPALDEIVPFGHDPSFCSGITATNLWPGSDVRRSCCQFVLGGPPWLRWSCRLPRTISCASRSRF